MGGSGPINHYTVLGVARDATLDEIKSAYRARIAEYHPDRNRSPHAHAYTALINDAWEVLSDPQRRRAYDDRLGEENFAAPPPPASSSTSPPGPSPVRLVSRAEARLSGALMIGAGIIFAILGDRDQTGDHYNLLLVLVFWVCAIAGIAFIRTKKPSRTKTYVACGAMGVALLVYSAVAPYLKSSVGPDVPDTTVATSAPAASSLPQSSGTPAAAPAIRSTPVDGEFTRTLKQSQAERAQPLPDPREWVARQRAAAGAAVRAPANTIPSFGDFVAQQQRTEFSAASLLGHWRDGIADWYFTDDELTLAPLHGKPADTSYAPYKVVMADAVNGVIEFIYPVLDAPGSPEMIDARVTFSSERTFGTMVTRRGSWANIASQAFGNSDRFVFIDARRRP
jgi:uncharacterized membrane protein